VRPVGLCSPALRNALSDLPPHGRHIQIKNGAHAGEGEEVLGIGQHPLPRLTHPSRYVSVAAHVAGWPFAGEARKGILQDGQA